MRTRIHSSLLTSGPVRRRYWYVPNPLIRTNAAARHAAEVAEWAAARCGLHAEPEEHTVFVALQTCAYRATRYAEGHDLAATEGDPWCGRWHHIRDYIFEKNLGLAYLMLGRLDGPDQDRDDRLSEAMCALAHAVERFNPWKGYRFSSYACNVIGHALAKHRNRERRYRRVVSTCDQPWFDRAAEYPDHRRELYLERLAYVMGKNLGNLNPVETKVIAERFPAGLVRRLTLQELAGMIGVTKERVRQIQNRALIKLRDAVKHDPLLQ